MHVIVCGGGQVGSSIAEYLSLEHAHVTLIDCDQAVIDRLNNTMDIRAIRGYASHPEVLREAGARTADMIIAVTREDEVNMVACQVAHTLFDVDTKIARLRHRDYLNPQFSDLFSKNHVPIDVVISPEMLVAESIQKRLQVPGAADVVPLANGAVYLLGIKTDADCPVLSTALSQLPEIFASLNMAVLGILRDNKPVEVTDEAQVIPGDDVYILVQADHIRRAMQAFGHHEKEAHRLLVVGGGRFGAHIARMVEEIPDVHARLVTDDEGRAQKLATSLPKTTILHGDALNNKFLEEIEIETTETFIAASEDDEDNIMACLLARKYKCPRVITMLNTSTYESLVSELGIDVVINPRGLTVSSILQHVRRGRVRSVYSVHEEFGEIIEVDVMKNSRLSGKAIEELPLPKESRIACIVRDSETIFPTPETIIEDKDRVITFASHSAIKKLERLFTRKTDW